ncbi:hypothetical protein EV182_001954 [Spiromyces aspiralis]|uniref:Uncharacterized protein n=1 Tax=Spiromyces aspiralis TaxID=68401 RepID=A0ACC1HTX0_9FUNG|nr:hypothetical protein EV182_001954 [Spiromyces aspiralis]
MNQIHSKRLRKDLDNMLNNPPSNIQIQDITDMRNWKITLYGAKGTLYEGEKYTLSFSFGSSYPIEPPEVMFVGEAPVHPHVSGPDAVVVRVFNGHICLSILAEGWSPALTVESVCVSILSMLSSCDRKIPPPDNWQYVRRARPSPKGSKWDFHDDKV